MCSRLVFIRFTKLCALFHKHSCQLPKADDHPSTTTRAPAHRTEHYSCNVLGTRIISEEVMPSSITVIHLCL